VNPATLLAHSAPTPDRQPHPYGDHVRGAVSGAHTNAEAVACYIGDPGLAARFLTTVTDGTAYHDLGKLEPENQAALHEGRNGRMRWDHVDAGVAHLMGCGAEAAAWIVRAHHAPGLPRWAGEFGENGSRLRGGRHGAEDLTTHTDAVLSDLVAAHAAVTDTPAPTPSKAKHGLFMRLAMSCLVDGDHGDAAGYEHGWRPPPSPAPRWVERLASLDAHVAELGREGGGRQRDRAAFYDACRHGPVDDSMVACDGPVGIGKTTAVAAWCLRRAIASGARRLFIVAPYTTILSQTAATLRKALLLPDEAGREDEVVAEHHHRAEFQDLASRDLALLWRAPIVVTTGVQFFETLAGCTPAQLRKLHGLPGSVVFLDEAHAALAAPLWRQNWAWMRDLARNWGCSFVFASGSLARVWEHEDIVGEKAVANLQDIAPAELAQRLNRAEHARVRYRTVGRVKDVVSLILESPGPRLAVFNTVKSAAVIADRLRKARADVLHLSTALCPSDRDRILEAVKARLDRKRNSDWTLVATSLVEAGVNISFRTALRERFSTASLIQIGGRANRHGDDGVGEVIDFQLDADDQLTIHRGAAKSAEVLGRMLKRGEFAKGSSPAELVTRALKDEVRDAHGGTGAPLAEAEGTRDYPGVSELGRLIDAETALVVVDAKLKDRLVRRETVSTRELLAGSVQIWSAKIDLLRLNEIPGRRGVYAWPYRYDPDLLGYMSGILQLESDEAFII
jgi:CRISPR-associated endonuclease/helicase Cas3